VVEGREIELGTAVKGKCGGGSGAEQRRGLMDNVSGAITDKADLSRITVVTGSTRGAGLHTWTSVTVWMS